MNPNTHTNMQIHRDTYVNMKKGRHKNKHRYEYKYDYVNIHITINMEMNTSMQVCFMCTSVHVALLLVRRAPNPGVQFPSHRNQTLGPCQSAAKPLSRVLRPLRYEYFCTVFLPPAKYLNIDPKSAVTKSGLLRAEVADLRMIGNDPMPDQIRAQPTNRTQVPHCLATCRCPFKWPGALFKMGSSATIHFIVVG